jgi:uncharacterized protein
MTPTNYPTKYLLEPDMKAYKQIFFLALIILFIPFTGKGQTDEIPAPPNPPRLVNDYAGFLNTEEQNYLERKLVALNDSTSTQIAIVIVKSLNGYDVHDFATRIGQKWGIGSKGKNNGIVVLIKPKTAEEKGQATISTGYGMEEFVTDALSKRIVETEMKPSFQAGQNFQGVNKAVDVLISLSKGQFTADQYMAGKKKKKNSGFPLGALIIIGILFVVFFSRGSSSNTRHLSGGGGLPLWLLLGGILGSRSGGGFSDFSSGSGSFGGFDGGDFGGGGASGSW